MELTARLQPSPIQLVGFNGYQILVKRDDLLNPYFSGNKARKLAYLLEGSFPHIRRIISYGSVQSNFLYSLSALAKLKQWKLDFYVNRTPDWLVSKPIGNYKGALGLGANIIEVDYDKLLDKNLEEFMKQNFSNVSEDTLLIFEGGRIEQAEDGIVGLAKELENHCQENNISDPVIMLPSGTGTTSLYLAKYFNNKNHNTKVVTCACVGDEAYLEKQFYELSNDKKDWPTILPTDRKYHFGKLYQEHYELWKDLKVQTGIEFDLLYDTIGWRVLLNYLGSNPKTKNVIYINQGGLLGNASMLSRYEKKYISV